MHVEKCGKCGLAPRLEPYYDWLRELNFLSDGVYKGYICLFVCLSVSSKKNSKVPPLQTTISSHNHTQRCYVRVIHPILL